MRVVLRDIQRLEPLVDGSKLAGTSTLLWLTTQTMSITKFIEQLPSRMAVQFYVVTYHTFMENRAATAKASVMDMIGAAISGNGGVPDIKQLYKDLVDSQYHPEFSVAGSFLGSPIISTALLSFSALAVGLAANYAGHRRELRLPMRVWDYFERPLINVSGGGKAIEFLNYVSPGARFMDMRTRVPGRNTDDGIQWIVFLVVMLGLLFFEQTAAMVMYGTLQGTGMIIGQAVSKSYYGSPSTAFEDYALTTFRYYFDPLIFWPKAALNRIRGRRYQVDLAEKAASTTRLVEAALTRLKETLPEKTDEEKEATKITAELVDIVDDPTRYHGSTTIYRLARELLPSKDLSDKQDRFRVAAALTPFLYESLSEIEKMFKERYEGIDLLRQNVKDLFGRSLMVNRPFPAVPSVIPATSGTLDPDQNDTLSDYFKSEMGGTQLVNEKLPGKNPTTASKNYMSAILYEAHYEGVNPLSIWKRFYKFMANASTLPTPLGSPSLLSEKLFSTTTKEISLAFKNKYTPPLGFNRNTKTSFEQGADKGLYLYDTVLKTITDVLETKSLTELIYYNPEDYKEIKNTFLRSRIRDEFGLYMMEYTRLLAYLTQLCYSGVIKAAIEDKDVLAGYTYTSAPAGMTKDVLENPPNTPQFILIRYILKTFVLGLFKQNSNGWYLVGMVVGPP
jgi:hypothetical protein